MGLKKAESQVKILLAETIMAMCRNTLNNHAEVNVEGLLGITLDNDEIFLVSINQTINNPDVPSKAKSVPESTETNDVDGEAHQRKRAKSKTNDSSSDSDEESTKEGKAKRRRKRKRRSKSSNDDSSSGSSESDEESSPVKSVQKVVKQDNDINSQDNNFDLDQNSYSVMPEQDEDQDNSLSNSENVRVKQERAEDDDEEDIVIIKEEMSDLHSDTQFMNMQQQFTNSTFPPDFNSTFPGTPQQSMSSDMSQPQPGPSSSNAEGERVSQIGELRGEQLGEESQSEEQQNEMQNEEPLNEDQQNEEGQNELLLTEELLNEEEIEEGQNELHQIEGEQNEEEEIEEAQNDEQPGEEILEELMDCPIDMIRLVRRHLEFLETNRRRRRPRRMRELRLLIAGRVMTLSELVRAWPSIRTRLQLPPDLMGDYDLEPYNSQPSIETESSASHSTNPGPNWRDSVFSAANQARNDFDQASLRLRLMSVDRAHRIPASTSTLTHGVLRAPSHPTSRRRPPHVNRQSFRGSQSTPSSQLPEISETPTISPSHFSPALPHTVQEFESNGRLSSEAEATPSLNEMTTPFSNSDASPVVQENDISEPPQTLQAVESADRLSSEMEATPAQNETTTPSSSIDASSEITPEIPSHEDNVSSDPPNVSSSGTSQNVASQEVDNASSSESNLGSAESDSPRNNQLSSANDVPDAKVTSDANDTSDANNASDANDASAANGTLATKDASDVNDTSESKDENLDTHINSHAEVTSPQSTIANSPSQSECVEAGCPPRVATSILRSALAAPIKSLQLVSFPSASSSKSLDTVEVISGPRVSQQQSHIVESEETSSEELVSNQSESSNVQSVKELSHEELVGDQSDESTAVKLESQEKDRAGAIDKVSDVAKSLNVVGTVEDVDSLVNDDSVTASKVGKSGLSDSQEVTARTSAPGHVAPSDASSQNLALSVVERIDSRSLSALEMSSSGQNLCVDLPVRSTDNFSYVSQPLARDETSASSVELQDAPERSRNVPLKVRIRRQLSFVQKRKKTKSESSNDSGEEQPARLASMSDEQSSLDDAEKYPLPYLSYRSPPRKRIKSPQQETAVDSADDAYDSSHGFESNDHPFVHRDLAVQGLELFDMSQDSVKDVTEVSQESEVSNRQDDRGSHLRRIIRNHEQLSLLGGIQIKSEPGTHISATSPVNIRYDDDGNSYAPKPISNKISDMILIDEKSTKGKESQNEVRYFPFQWYPYESRVYNVAVGDETRTHVPSSSALDYSIPKVNNAGSDKSDMSDSSNRLHESDKPERLDNERPSLYTLPVHETDIDKEMVGLEDAARNALITRREALSILQVDTRVSQKGLRGSSKPWPKTIPLETAEVIADELQANSGTSNATINIRSDSVRHTAGNIAQDYGSGRFGVNRSGSSLGSSATYTPLSNGNQTRESTEKIVSRGNLGHTDYTPINQNHPLVSKPLNRRKLLSSMLQLPSDIAHHNRAKDIVPNNGETLDLSISKSAQKESIRKEPSLSSMSNLRLYTLAKDSRYLASNASSKQTSPGVMLNLSLKNGSEGSRFSQLANSAITANVNSSANPSASHTRVEANNGVNQETLDLSAGHTGVSIHQSRYVAVDNTYETYEEGEVPSGAPQESWHVHRGPQLSHSVRRAMPSLQYVQPNATASSMMSTITSSNEDSDDGRILANSSGHPSDLSLSNSVSNSVSPVAYSNPQNSDPSSAPSNRTCPFCGKVFASRNAVLIHTVVHTGEKNFPCQVCGVSFNTKGNMVRHMQRKHNYPKGPGYGRSNDPKFDDI